MNMFRFENPDMLYLLLLVPALIALYLYSAYDRRRRIARLGNAATIRSLMPDSSVRREHLKFSLYIIGITLAVIALARPQFGSKLKEVKREGIELMLAVDVSNSMLAEDFAPNRLERTKYSIARLLEGLHQDRVGLIVFAGDAYVQLPITSDYLTARSFVERVSPTMVSKQGTAIGAAIDLAANSFSSQSEGSRAIILITDGENHEDNPIAAAKRAADEGIKIYAIGIGTPEGAPIKLDGDFIRDENGDMVVSKLDESTLREVALSTGGAYIRSTDRSMGLAEIIAKIKETESSEFTIIQFEEYDERYHYLLAVALVLIVLDTIIQSRRNRRLRHLNIFTNKE